MTANKVAWVSLAFAMLYLLFHLFAAYLRIKYQVDILEPLP